MNSGGMATLGEYGALPNWPFFAAATIINVFSFHGADSKVMLFARSRLVATLSARHKKNKKNLPRSEPERTQMW